MKSLVTGGAGFIGSNLVDRLLELGHEVVCVDNEYSDVHDHFYWNEKAYNVKCDIRDYKSLKNCMTGVIMFFTLLLKQESNQQLKILLRLSVSTQ